MKQLPFVSILLLLIASPILAADYAVEEMREDGTPTPPFSIARVESFTGGLRLFLSTGDIAPVAGLIASGTLESQLSDHQAETQTSVTLSLGKAAWCT